MANIKYHFNTHTLKYEQVIVSWKNVLLRWFGWLSTAVVFALIMLFAYNF
ncbi:MAG: hypothetical protein U0X76_10345 [Bacteroidia bacterium]